VLVAGELLADIVASPGPGPAMTLTARPGGGPANVAVGLARLGLPAEFVGRVSVAGVGPWLREHLVGNGVGTTHTVAAAQLPTLAFVGLDAHGVPSYAFYGPTTADWYWDPAELPDAAGSAAVALHTGTLACALPPGAAVLAAWADRLRADGVLVSYDPNVRPTLIPDLAAFVEVAAGWVRRSHLVKVSEEDLSVLHPGRDPMSTAAQWAGAGPELVVVTRGEHGAVAFRPDGTTLARPGPAIVVADTVGAGDAFAAGLLAWLAGAGALHPGGPAGLADEQLAAALDQAIEVAAITCTRFGADPPYAAELTGAGA
jgi:fructokinase